MTANEYIESNLQNINKAARNISGSHPLWKDLVAESILVFLQKPDLQSIVDSGGSLFYIVRIMSNQWKSQTSPFWRNYRGYSEEVPDIEEDEEPDRSMEDYLMKELEEMHWYGKTLFKLHYLEGESISKISRETNIPRSSITLEIKRVKDSLLTKAKGYTS